MDVVWIKRDRFPMKLLQVLIQRKVYEYEDADLLVVRKKPVPSFHTLRLTEGTHCMKKR